MAINCRSPLKGNYTLTFKSQKIFSDLREHTVKAVFSVYIITMFKTTRYPPPDLFDCESGMYYDRDGRRTPN
jgi:hypothetical protein